ncbi:hypothetical protein B0H21DRAFT_686457 [Amylocystis lapponica]|nr:hypothetical protein B0H21DRAFT_686457 [Amylocystis lapponica]
MCAAPPSAKAVADLITRLRTELAKLTALQAQQEAGMEDMGIQVEGLLDDTGTLGERVLALENRLAEFLHRFSALEKAVDELQVGGVMQHANPADEGDAKPRKRNNALQSVVRACLYGYMGITKATPPPEPLPDGRFWTEDDPESPDRLLRPHWDEWSENQVAWLREMVHAVQDKGYKYSNSMTSEKIAAVPISTIEAAIEASYESMRQRYKALHQPLTDQQERARQNRRKGRKKAKATERENHRAEVPALQAPGFNFAFKWQYQSTDESDNEGGAIDANTDNESDDEVPVVTNSRQRPWKSRPPQYRVPLVNEQLRILDKRVVAEQLNSSNQGNAHHARVVGEPKNTPLPTIRKARNTATASVKIPRTMVDAQWLAENPYSNKASLMAPEDEVEVEVGGEGDENVGEDVQEEMYWPIDPVLM